MDKEAEGLKSFEVKYYNFQVEVIVEQITIFTTVHLSALFELGSMVCSNYAFKYVTI